jgi:hypothetical protein
MALVCLKCASADCGCGRLAGIVAEAALVEAAAVAGGSGDPEPDDIAIELASLLCARQRLGERMVDAPCDVELPIPFQ